MMRRMESPLTDLQLDGPETTRFRGVVDGEDVGEGTLTFRPEGRGLVQEIAGAAYGRLEGTTSTQFRIRGEELIAESQEIELLHKGKVVFTESKSFRDVQVPQLGGLVGSYPRTMVPGPAVALALRALPWAEKAKFSPPVWLTAIVHWPLDMRVEKKEKITVDAGSFQAWRIRLRPSLVDVAQALDELSANVVPPVYAYVDTDSSRLIKLDFPTGPGRNDPRGHIEAVDLG